MLVEDRNQEAAQLRIVAACVRRVDRMVKHHELPRRVSLRKCGIEPFGLLLCLPAVRNGQGAVEDGEEGASRLELVHQSRLDAGGSVSWQWEKGSVETRPAIQVFMVPRARHDGDSLEDFLGAKEEMIPVRLHFATVH